MEKQNWTHITNKNNQANEKNTANNNNKTQNLDTIFKALKNARNYTGIKTGMTVIDQIPSYCEHSESKSIKLECKHAENCIFSNHLMGFGG